MTYHLTAGSRFERRLKRFKRKNPELIDRVNEVLRDLQTDPFQPRLKLHALSGNLRGHHAVRIDYAHRVVLILNVSERIIRLVGIGSHDEVYR